MGKIRFNPNSGRGVFFGKHEEIQFKATKEEILKENKGLSNISEEYPNPNAGCAALSYWLWYYAPFVGKDQSELDVAKTNPKR